MLVYMLVHVVYCTTLCDVVGTFGMIYIAKNGFNWNMTVVDAFYLLPTTKKKRPLLTCAILHAAVHNHAVVMHRSSFTAA